MFRFCVVKQCSFPCSFLSSAVMPGLRGPICNVARCRNSRHSRRTRKSRRSSSRGERGMKEDVESRGSSSRSEHGF